MLDAHTALYLLRGLPAVRDRARTVGQRGKSLAMSAIVHSQLLQGIPEHPQTAAEIERLTLVVPVLPYDQSASEAYGAIVVALSFSRSLALDRMIAAHAISVGARERLKLSATTIAPYASDAD